MAEEAKTDAEELPAEEREELEALFSMMDKNGDGELSAEELFDALTELGVNDGDVSREHVEAMMKAGDADGNGAIDKEEFVQAIAKLRAESGYAVMPARRGSLGSRKASVGMISMLSTWWSSGAEASENDKRLQEELAKKQKKAEKLAALKAEKSKAAAEKVSRKLMQQRVQAGQMRHPVQPGIMRADRRGQAEGAIATDGGDMLVARNLAHAHDCGCERRRHRCRLQLCVRYVQRGAQTRRVMSR